MTDRIPTLTWFLLGALVLPPAQARNLFVPDAAPPTPSSVTEATPWTESASGDLPSWPRDEDLIEFIPDGARSELRYFIDERSLVIGNDQVVRFTLVAQGPSGARNVSFEGIRCTPQGTYRTYAFGSGGRFEPVSGEDWQRIGHHAPERWRHDLWRFHFCAPQGFKPRARQDMLRSLKGRINPRQNTGFHAD